AQQSEPTASRDKLYGLMLLGVVVGINLMAYSLLSAWESHIKPRYTAPTLPKGGPFVEPTDGSPRDSVTLYLSPTDERRTLRIERLDMPLDTTDAIVLPPANPEDDQ
ncbi:MAG: hypothetical protein C0436_03305, partial [Alphaproteobacteria bacterium]|nr:hypothetical protein [Alphaproteobacteria bacterium]